MRWLLAVLVILLLLLQYPLWFGEGSLPDTWRLESQIEKQKLENAQLAERNRVLESEVEDLKQGLDVVEEKARNELGMIKKNETYYQIIEKPENEQ